MKKIITTFLLLLVVCCIPTIVSAKELNEIYTNQNGLPLRVMYMINFAISILKITLKQLPKMNITT